MPLRRKEASSLSAAARRKSTFSRTWHHIGANRWRGPQGVYVDAPARRSVPTRAPPFSAHATPPNWLYLGPHEHRSQRVSPTEAPHGHHRLLPVLHGLGRRGHLGHHPQGRHRQQQGLLPRWPLAQLPAHRRLAAADQPLHRADGRAQRRRLHRRPGGHGLGGCRPKSSPT